MIVEHDVYVKECGIAYAKHLISKACPVCGKSCVDAGEEKIGGSSTTKRRAYAHVITIQNDGRGATQQFRRKCWTEPYDPRGPKG